MISGAVGVGSKNDLERVISFKKEEEDCYLKKREELSPWCCLEREGDIREAEKNDSE